MEDSSTTTLPTKELALVTYRFGREGTSLLMGLLELAGYQTPKKAGPAPMNPKGFFEDPEWESRLANSLGINLQGTETPPENLDFPAAGMPEEEFISEFSNRFPGDRIALKNPRGIYFPYLKALSKNYRVSIIRIARNLDDQTTSVLRVWEKQKEKPESLKNSDAIRGFLEQWNTFLEKRLESLACPSFDYDQIIDNPRSEVDRLTEALGTDRISDAALSQWIDPALRRSSGPTDNGSVSVCVVYYDEKDIIDECLQRLSDFPDRILLDMSMDQAGKQIADVYGFRHYTHAKTVSGEAARQFAYEIALNDWIFFVDPDEFVPPALAKRVLETPHHASDRIALVGVPWQFYFLGKKLSGTHWGGVIKKRVLANRKRIYSDRNSLHQGITARPEFEAQDWPPDSVAPLEHYWARSLSVFLVKHYRYLFHRNGEGPTRFRTGKRTTFWRTLKSPLVEFKNAYFTRKGYSDGFVGLFLSLFWATYQFAANSSLLLCQLKHASKSKTAAQPRQTKEHI